MQEYYLNNYYYIHCIKLKYYYGGWLNVIDYLEGFV